MRSHLLKGCLHGYLEIFFCPFLCSQFRNNPLNSHSCLKEIEVNRFAQMKEEGEGVGRPVAHGAPEKRPASGPRFGNPQNAEGPQGLPEGRKTDPQEFCKLPLGGKLLPEFEVFLVNQFLDFRNGILDNGGLTDRLNLHRCFNCLEKRLKCS